MTLHIQDIRIQNPVVLAPMSGITDLPFRNLVKQLGAGLVISEMMASELLSAGRADMVRKIAAGGGEGPFVVQLAGREAKWMALGAKMALDAGAQMIDINMGCPARKVTKGASGSALMRDLDHAMTLIRAVLSAVSIPISLKMRLGWDPQNINAPELAKRAADAGVSMVSVHGRTRSQFYKGTADWAAIAAVRDVIDIPLLVNGDIHNVTDAKRAMALSGGDGVMIGRAACGQPWLPGNIARQLAGQKPIIYSMAEKLEFILQQFEGSLELYGQALGIRMFRKHIAWSIDHAFEGTQGKLNPAKLRGHICRLENAAQIKDELRRAFLTPVLAA